MEMNESHVGTQRQYTHAHTCTANKEISFFALLYLLTLRTLKTVHVLFVIFRFWR